MQNSFKFPLKTIFVLLTAHVAQTASALTTLNDVSFPPYSTTGVSSATDDIEIVTTSATSSPQINITGSMGQTGLLATGSNTLTVNSDNKFVVQSSITGGYNAFYGTHLLSGTLHAKSELEFNLVDGRGIYAVNGGTGTFDQKVTINSTGQAIGLMAYSTTANAGKAHFKDELVINASGNNSFGIVTQQGNPNGEGPELIFDQKVTVNMTGNSSIGLSTQDIAPGGTLTNSLIHFKNGLDLENIGGLGIDSGLAHSEIKIDGNSRIITGLNSSAIKALQGKVSINGQSVIEGDIDALNTGEVSLNLSAGSSLKGRFDNHTIDILPPGYVAGRIDLNFNGAGSTWELTDSSYINSLKGNGHFLLATDIQAGTGTVLHVTDANGTEGNHTVTIADTGTGTVASTYEQVVISTNGVQAGTAFTMPTFANIGAYQYDIKQVGNDWVLAQVKDKPLLSNTTSALFNNVRASYLMSYTETQTLLQRMGELRNSAADGQNHVGVWSRAFFSDMDVKGKDGLSSFDQKYNGVQIGADWQSHIQESDRVYLGGTFGYTNSEQSYKTGDGEIDSYYVGIYGTYVKDNGFYVDNLLKLGRQEQSIHLTDNMGRSVNADTDSNSISWSTEIGYQAYLDAQKKEGFYIEPQAQITLGRVSGDQFTTSNGSDVKFDSYRFTLGRLGLLAGYTLKTSANPINIYVKSSYTHEFSGDLKGRINGDAISTNLGSSWWTYGLGANANIQSNHNVYFDVERSTGGDFKQLWKLNGGYRFTW